MKLVSFRVDGGARLGVAVGDRVVDVAATYAANFPGDADNLQTMRAFLNGGAAAREAAQQVHALAIESPDKATTTDAALTAPVPDPPKLLCLAGNYAEHIREGGGIALEKEQTTPRVFMKPPSTTIVGPGDAIFIHHGDGATTNQHLGINLQTDQRLIGEGVGLDVPGIGTIVPPGSPPLIAGEWRAPKCGTTSYVRP